MSELPESIKEALEELEQYRDTILSYSAAAEACDAIAKRHRKPDAEKYDSPRVSIGWQSGQLHGGLYHMDVERIEEVTAALKEFSALGWHRKKEDPSDYPELRRRSFTLVHEIHKCEIILSAFFIGETCKFVEVGQETKPKYELRCEVEA